MQQRKLHLINPTTGERKWYLIASPMVFFFATLLFPFVTRRLWAWLAVWVIYDVFAIVMILAEDAMAPNESRVVDLLLQWLVFGLSVWACLVANKQATRKLLAQGWLVSSDTNEEAWQLFQKKWKLPDGVRQTGPNASTTITSGAGTSAATGPIPSGMVFCRGCGHRIHETAPTCPQCGAPQAVVGNRAP